MPYPKDSNKTFIKKAVKKWGDRYDYTLVNYINSRSSVIIICRKHKHEFEQTPKAHFAAKRHCCPLCYEEVAGMYQNKWRCLKKPISVERASDKFSSLLGRVFRDV